MCNCIDNINERLEEKNTRINVAIGLFGASDKVLVSTLKIRTKERGKAINLIAAYCPFCGKKYPEDRE